ncbi:MAG: hypothetical protein ACOCX1_01115 [Fimbriimonadaceae bacterium]
MALLRPPFLSPYDYLDGELTRTNEGTDLVDLGGGDDVAYLRVLSRVASQTSPSD